MQQLNASSDRDPDSVFELRSTDPPLESIRRALWNNGWCTGRASSASSSSTRTPTVETAEKKNASTGNDRPRRTLLQEEAKGTVQPASRPADSNDDPPVQEDSGSVVIAVTQPGTDRRVRVLRGIETFLSALGLFVLTLYLLRRLGSEENYCITVVTSRRENIEKTTLSNTAPWFDIVSTTTDSTPSKPIAFVPEQSITEPVSLDYAELPFLRDVLQHASSHERGIMWHDNLTE